MLFRKLNKEHVFQFYCSYLVTRSNTRFPAMMTSDEIHNMFVLSGNSWSDSIYVYTTVAQKCDLMTEWCARSGGVLPSAPHRQ